MKIWRYDDLVSYSFLWLIETIFHQIMAFIFLSGHLLICSPAVLCKYLALPSDQSGWNVLSRKSLAFEITNRKGTTRPHVARRQREFGAENIFALVWHSKQITSNLKSSIWTSYILGIAFNQLQWYWWWSWGRCRVGRMLGPPLSSEKWRARPRHYTFLHMYPAYISLTFLLAPSIMHVYKFYYSALS